MFWISLEREKNEVVWLLNLAHWSIWVITDTQHLLSLWNFTFQLNSRYKKQKDKPNTISNSDRSEHQVTSTIILGFCQPGPAEEPSPSRQTSICIYISISSYQHTTDNNHLRSWDMLANIYYLYTTHSMHVGVCVLHTFHCANGHWSWRELVYKLMEKHRKNCKRKASYM
jgi:hypothetical protein